MVCKQQIKYLESRTYTRPNQIQQQIDRMLFSLTPLNTHNSIIRVNFLDVIQVRMI